MKTPMPPPDLDALQAEIQRNGGRWKELLHQAVVSISENDDYLPWDTLRYKTPPAGLSHAEWWYTVKLARRARLRRLPLMDKTGQLFSYALLDKILRGVEDITRSASGTISISEQVTNPATRDRYLVNSLIEESITSSQLEGAVTTRNVAKEMLRTGRPPRTRDERMIANNFQAMKRITELRQTELTPEFVCEIHRIVTEGTLDDPAGAGRLQFDQEKRVSVFDSDNRVLHSPPPVDELPERLDRLCRFANNSFPGSPYIPPVLRAITIHFMLGYDHPFEDGNGRTARALFYWSMLREGYWLTEFLSISRILKGAPSQYARSFLYTEQDEGDLTYFHIYHVNVVQRAIKELHEYLARKMSEVRDFQRSLALLPGEFNHRQLALLEHAVKDANARYTAVSHSASHNVTPETARQDLLALQQRGLLDRIRVGKAHTWVPVEGIIDKLR